MVNEERDFKEEEMYSPSPAYAREKEGVSSSDNAEHDKQNDGGDQEELVQEAHRPELAPEEGSPELAPEESSFSNEEARIRDTIVEEDTEVLVEQYENEKLETTKTTSDNADLEDETATIHDDTTRAEVDKIEEDDDEGVQGGDVVSPEYHEETIERTSAEHDSIAAIQQEEVDIPKQDEESGEVNAMLDKDEGEESDHEDDEYEYLADGDGY